MELISSKRILVKVAPYMVTELQTVVEACDGLAVSRTLDPEIAVVELLATPDTYDDTLRLARSLEKTLNARVLHPR